MTHYTLVGQFSIIIIPILALIFQSLHVTAFFDALIMPTISRHDVLKSQENIKDLLVESPELFFGNVRNATGPYQKYFDTLQTLRFDSFNVLENSMVLQQTLPPGACYTYDPDTSPNVCGTVIGAGTSRFMPQGMSPELLTAQLPMMMPMLSMTSPIADCDLALFTMLCNVLYPPCVDVPLNPDAPEVTTAIPMMPCDGENGYKTTLSNSCFVMAALGFFEMPEIFPFAPQPMCNVGLQIAPRTYTKEGSTATLNTLPPIGCPHPLVQVDLATYKHNTLLGSTCAMPCPSPLMSPTDYHDFDNFLHGWQHISFFLGFILMGSYAFIPKLRKRRLVVCFVSTIFACQIVTYIIFFQHIVAGHPPTTITCSGPADEHHAYSALCVFSLITPYAMFSSLLAVVSMGLDVFLLVVLELKFTPQQNKLRQRICLAVAYIYPAIYCIALLAAGALDGGGSGAGTCTVAVNRDSPHMFKWSEWQTWTSLGLVFIAYIFFFSVIAKLIYLQRTVGNDKTDFTSAQVRILALIFIMTSIYMGILANWIDMKHRLTSALAKAIPEWMVCLFTMGSQDICGVAPNTHGLKRWAFFLLWVSSTTALTASVVQLCTRDLDGWFVIVFKLTGWQWLKPYAVTAGYNEEADGNSKTREGSAKEESTSANASTTSQNSTTKSMNKMFKGSALPAGRSMAGSVSGRYSMNGLNDGTQPSSPTMGPTDVEMISATSPAMSPTLAPIEDKEPDDLDLETAPNNTQTSVFFIDERKNE